MASSPANSRSQLFSRLRADQSERWQRGERVRVEHYLDQYPDLTGDTELFLGLIHAEILLRSEQGDTPLLNEYVARFPAHAELLRSSWRLLFLLHHPASLPGATLADALTTPVTRSPRPLPGLPGYEILEEIGRGGMGVVYRARERELDRIVALKLLRAGPLAGAEEAARFRTEARAVARLRHRGVVQVFTFGQHDELAYLVMEYLPGGSLADRLQDGTLPVREAATLVRDLARAVQAAHDAGVVHRDLKPGNVLLDADGTARISDFGLARLLDLETGWTRTDMLLGTPAYMSPEQAAGNARQIGPAADIWALGVILYECLTRQPPFRASTRGETLDRIRTVVPVPPAKLRPEVPRELSAVCLRCLEKPPHRRYRSASALADDLDHWLLGEPVAAGRSGPARRRTAVALGVFLCLVILGVLAALAPSGNSTSAEGNSAAYAVRKVQSTLQRGTAVPLIGDQGMPRWFTIVEGKGRTQTSRAADGAFSVDTWNVALVELLPDPGVSRYRIRAEVRHERSDAIGEVGIYFAHQVYPTPTRPLHSLLQVIYNDIIPLTIDHFRGRLPPWAPMPPEPVGNPVSLARRFYLGSPTLNDEWDRRVVDRRKQLFKPAGGIRAGPWRPLQVEVSPDVVRASWDGKVFGEIESRELEALTRATVQERRTQRPADSWLEGVAAELNPRGGLGLYVVRSAASFRRFVVEPLE